MAYTSTFKTFLMYKATSEAENYTKLLDVVDTPDLGASPEGLDATTQTHSQFIYIKGLLGADAMEYTANYEPDVYDTIKALEDKGEPILLSEWLGGTVGTDGLAVPDGSDGKFNFTGYISVFKNGGGVNEVRRMTVTVIPTTPIVKATD